MSVADLGSHEREFERTPPHDVAAEQSVLGGMLLSPNAIAEVLEVLRATDFYRPAHQILYDTILDLYGRGEPADAVTIVAELTKRGDITRVGGAPYLHTLMATVPTAANASYYAKIVRERAVLRKLVEVGTRIVQLGYASDGADADEVLDRAQAEVFAIADKRTGEDYVPLSEIMPGALDEIEAIGSRGGQMTGVPTGFADLDALTNGLHPGQMVVVAARPAMGKALAIDTPLPTPSGWTTMGEVGVGDYLFGADGTPTQVVAATEVMDGRPCFELTFSDGSVIVADAEHLWQVRTRSLVMAGAVGSSSVRTTAEIYRAACAGALDHAVDVAAPFELPFAALPEDPYVVGQRAVSHIPFPYLRASVSQRRALLAGLRDASGSVRVADRRLAEDALELMRSLGYRATMRRAGRGFIVSGRGFIVSGRRAAHEIVGVRPVGSVPVRCVQVSSPDRLYLAGRAGIPTHNSTLALDFARAASIKHGLTSAFFSLEMGRNEITMRLLSAEARVALHSMRSGTLQDEDWQRLARRMSEVAEAPLFIDDSPNMSMMEIRAKCRRLKQQHDLRLVIIDYLQLMSSGKRVESRQVEVSEFSRSLKLLAKELGVPVIALSQLNRGPEQRTDKKPMVSDLRESGCLTAGTRLLRADTGTEITLGELLSSGARDVPVWSLDDRLKLVPRTLTHAFASGIKETFRVRLASGRSVEATANHPFLTYDGWRALGELAVGARVAALRHVPPPLRTRRMPAEEIVVLARGSRVTDEVRQLPKEQLAFFLRQLWAAGGRVEWDDLSDSCEVCYDSASDRVIDDLAGLLLRFGVFSQQVGLPSGHRLWVPDPGNQLAFLEAIGFASEPIVSKLRALRADAVTHEIWNDVGEMLSTRLSAPSRIATMLDKAELELAATNDVRWDEIEAITPLGPLPVYDATVMGTHNFVANGINLKNSIEQDADMVILLHREDAYEKESPRAGEADLIVAKHRNGPTATVTVAFQGHYSRFVDMAQ